MLAAPSMGDAAQKGLLRLSALAGLQRPGSLGTAVQGISMRASECSVLQMCQHLENLTRTIEITTAPMFQTATASKVCSAIKAPQRNARVFLCLHLSSLHTYS